MSTSVPGKVVEPAIRPVPLASIQKEPRVSNGAALDPGRVCVFSDLMRAGAIVPPIKVWWGGEHAGLPTAGIGSHNVLILCELINTQPPNPPI
jgi:hypothetical protein